MRDVSFGQYYPTGSVVHRLDPRSKLIFVIVYIVMLFFIPTVSKYMDGGGSVLGYLTIAGFCYALALLFIITAVLAAKIPFGKVLKSVRMVLFLVIFMTLISMLFYDGTENATHYTWWIFDITDEGLLNAGSMALRLIFLVLGPSILTLTTTPVELTDGLESLLTPLKWIKFPVHEMAIIMSIALRLIPQMIEETDKIKNAQRARCADFDSGNIFKRAKAMMPVLIPLFVSSFRRAGDLAEAMESRCYHGAKGRTRMKKLRFHFKDLFALILVAAIFTAVLFLRYDWYGLASMLLAALGV